MAAARVVFITGGNTGIGFETVKALLRSDHLYHIYLGGRNAEKARDAAKAAQSEVQSQSSVEPIQIDVESDESINNAYTQVAAKQSKIDALINNAGAQFEALVDAGQMTPRQAWNKTWDVNVTGAHVTTLTFLPLLLKSSDPRLLFLTSGLSSLELSSDPGSPWYKTAPAGLPKQFRASGYRSSKAGLNMLMLEWHRAVVNDGVKVWSIAPGLLATGLAQPGNPEVMRKMGAKDPSIGGTVIRNVMEGKRDAEVGKVVREYDSPIQPW